MLINEAVFVNAGMTLHRSWRTSTTKISRSKKTVNRLGGHLSRVLHGPRNTRYSVKVFKFWNRLPRSILTTSSDDLFKRHLDATL